jgi:protein-disulfide isomerase
MLALSELISYGNMHKIFDFMHILYDRFPMQNLVNILFFKTPFVLRSMVIACVLGGLAGGTVQLANAAEPFDQQQREEIESVIYDYLLKNPEVLVEAFSVLQAREQLAKKANLSQTLVSIDETLYNDPWSPQGGNLEGSVTIIEFFDYRCGYCKKVFPDIQKVIADDSDIRVIYKEFPILGDDSVFASRASIAIWLTWPEKYHDFHAAMMGSRGTLSETRVFEYAASIGVDLDDLKQAMKSEIIDQSIIKTAELARLLNISGTPGFIIGNELIPGAISLDDIKELVEIARSNS